jgi:hypothetical protein
MLIFRHRADNSAARLWLVIVFAATLSNEIAHSSEFQHHRWLSHARSLLECELLLCVTMD